MNDEHIATLVVEANPVDPLLLDRVPSDLSERELCDAIVASDLPGRRSRRPYLLLPVAAIVILVVGLVALWPGGVRSAQAALRAAAASTEGATSGRVELVIVNTGSEPWRYRSVAAFNGEDASSTVTLEWEMATANPRIETETRFIDDRIYTRGNSPWLDGSVWYESLDRHEVDVGTGEDGSDHLLFEFGVPTAVSRGGASGLVALMETADEFDEIGDNTYTASVLVGDLRTLPEVPPGLAHLTASSTILDTDAVWLTTQIDGSGYMSSLVTEYGSTSFTTTFTDLDAGIVIEVPADARPYIEPTIETAEPRLKVSRFFNEHPDICSDDIGRGSEYADCLRAAGHQDIADAADQLLAYANSGS